MPVWDFVWCRPQLGVALHKWASAYNLALSNWASAPGDDTSVTSVQFLQVRRLFRGNDTDGHRRGLQLQGCKSPKTSDCRGGSRNCVQLPNVSISKEQFQRPATSKTANYDVSYANAIPPRFSIARTVNSETAIAITNRNRKKWHQSRE